MAAKLDPVTARMFGFLKLIGEALRSRRETKQLKQTTVADEARVSRSTYNEMESGQRMYRIDAFIRVLDILQFDIMRIFETPRPSRLSPHHEVLHRKVDELLSAGNHWPQTIEANINALHAMWKRGIKQRSNEAGA